MLAGLGTTALAALALPRPARAATPVGAFLDLGRARLSGEVVRTSGWGRGDGVGAGDYGADALAQRLGGRFDRFVVRSANGRWYRLLPDASATITVEQGGAQGSGVDDRAAIQQALDYARAIGVERVGLTRPAYDVHVTRRTSDKWREVAGGYGLVVADDQAVTLVGLGAGRSRLLFRSPDGAGLGGDRAGVSTQAVGGREWRGSGIFVATHRRAGDPRRSALALERVELDGGHRRDRARGSAQSLKWDVTHKGIWVQADQLGGSVSLVDCALTGWRGECVYGSNDPQARLHVRRVEASHSNGQGLNPNGCQVDVAGCRIGNCYLGIEGWTGGAGGRIVDTVIEDCGGPNGSGGAFALQGGKYGSSARSRFYAPQRVVESEDPVGLLDITCRNSGRALAGWWLKGRLVLEDTTLTLGAVQAFDEGSQQLDLDVALAGDAQVVIAGGKGQRGDRLTDNVVLRLSGSGGRVPPVIWRGSIGRNVRVQLPRGNWAVAPRAAGPVWDSAPRLDWR